MADSARERWREAGRALEVQAQQSPLAVALKDADILISSTRLTHPNDKTTTAIASEEPTCSVAIAALANQMNHSGCGPYHVAAPINPDSHTRTQPASRSSSGWQSGIRDSVRRPSCRYSQSAVACQEDMIGGFSGKLLPFSLPRDQRQRETPLLSRFHLY